MSIKIGKLGIIRLKGKDLEKLRRTCWELDFGLCQECGMETFYQSRFDGDPQAYDMAHIRNKRMYGDTPDNVQCLCHRCHMREHNEGKTRRTGSMDGIR